MPSDYVAPRGPSRRRVATSRCGACRNPLFCADCREIERAKERKRTANTRRSRRSVIAERYTLADVASQYGWSCWICGAECLRPAADVRRYHPDLASVDHLIPLSRKGPDVVANIRIAHLRCNVSRGATVDLDRIAPMLERGGILIDGDEHGFTWCWLDELG